MSSPQELLLLRRLGLSVYSRSLYFKLEFLPNVARHFQANKDEALQVLVQMLTELGTLLAEDRELLELLRTTAFLPSRDAVTGETGSCSLDENQAVGDTLYRADQLFDPLNEDLASVLPSKSFPAAVLCREDALAFLRAAGLRTSLDWSDILRCAESIGTGGDGDVSSRRRRGNSLLCFVDRNASRLFMSADDLRKQKARVTATGGGKGLFRALFDDRGDDEARSFVEEREQCLVQLRALDWIPTVPLCPDPSMPSPANPVAPLAPPTSCRPQSDGWFCSASLALVDTAVHSPDVIKALGWALPIAAPVAAVQLRELAAAFLRDRQSMGSSDSDSEVAGTVQRRARDVFPGLVPQLYSRLNASMADADLFCGVLATLEAQAWIWVGDTFVRPEQVAFSTSVNAAPYLHQVPQEFLSYHGMLATCGVREAFTAVDYIQV